MSIDQPSIADGPREDVPAVPMIRRARAITWRSLLIGTAGVCFVCGVSPYNDYILENTMVVGSYLPLAVVLTVMLLVLGVNIPLHKWAPKRALRPGELAVIIGMMLVAGSIPGQGLLRSFLPSLIFPFYHGNLDASFWKTFSEMRLPMWLWPVHDMQSARTDPVMTEFFGRSPNGIGPYARWIAPLAVWSIFVAGMWSALLGLAAIVRYQWAENERLAFPLARVQASLIEPPAPGRLVNQLFGSGVFWIGLGGVFVLQSLAALHKYFPTSFPEIPLKYNLGVIMRNEPWVYLGGAVKGATLYFTYIGITYFIQSKLAFSLFAFFLIQQIVNVESQMVFHREINVGAWGDQHLGATVVFLLATIWIGRHHWWRVIRQMFGAAPARGGSEGGYFSYRVAGWMVVGGFAVMTGWLVLVGVKLWFALAIVAFLLMCHIVVARIVAQTGLPFIRVHAMLPQLYTETTPLLLGAKDIFWGGIFTMNGPYPTRESMLPFALHAMQINEAATEAPEIKQRRRFAAAMIFALVLGFVVACIAALWCYYYYAMPLASDATSFENPGGLEIWPKSAVIEPLDRWSEGKFPSRPYDNWLHKGIGAGVMALLQFLSLRYVNWPLSPVGYLITATWYIQMAWFSLFVGWLAKVLIVRYGGIGLYERFKPLFIGLIFGESAAAAVWMVVNLVLALSGHQYQKIQMLPF